MVTVFNIYEATGKSAHDLLWQNIVKATEGYVHCRTAKLAMCVEGLCRVFIAKESTNFRTY